MESSPPQPPPTFFILLLTLSFFSTTLYLETSLLSFPLLIASLLTSLLFSPLSQIYPRSYNSFTPFLSPSLDSPPYPLLESGFCFITESLPFGFSKDPSWWLVLAITVEVMIAIWGLLPLRMAFAMMRTFSLSGLQVFTIVPSSYSLRKDQFAIQTRRRLLLFMDLTMEGADEQIQVIRKGCPI